MAIVTTDNQYYSDIAAAIRKKLGVSRQYRPDEMAAAIESIGATQGIPMAFTGNPVIATDTIANQPFAGFKIFGKTAHDETSGLVSAGETGEVALQITGANICPISGGATNFQTDCFVLAGAQYTICAKQSVLVGFRIQIRDVNDPNSSIESIAIYDNNTTWKDSGYVVFTPTQSGKVFINSFAQCEWSELAIYVGALTARQYDTYQSQPFSISTPNGLPGVPVSSGGNCTDSTGQAYTSDYWDFGDGLQHILCGQISSYNGEEITTPYISSTGDLITGAQVVYVLPEPQTQPIPAETLAAYHALTTYANTTVISTAEPVAGMEATVYCDAGVTVQRLQGEIQTLSNTTTQLSRTANTLPGAE